MIKEEVIVILLPVSRIGQRVYFQKNLPADTKRIIGLEYGITLIDGGLSILPLPAATEFDIVPDKIIGRLTLQVAGKEGIFFRGDLMEDRNFYLGESATLATWQPAPWSHGGAKLEMELGVYGKASFIEGIFCDSYGVNEYETLSYQLHLYLWIEKCIA